jgi:FHS family L-fucose permease-like MFS transporter
MALSQQSSALPVANSEGRNYTRPFILVTTLFFLWGMAYGLLDVLNKHFQEALHISKRHSTLLQAAYFGAYFLVALPAGLFMNKYGYKKGIILGLLLYSCGAFLFYPAALKHDFNFFVAALFVLASGLTCLETAANPYATVLGKPETSAFRLNLSQCFNGVGSFIGPVIAANVFFGTQGADQLDSVRVVYLVIGTVVLMVAVLFLFTRLPEIKEGGTVTVVQDSKPLMAHRNFTGALPAQFFYVAAQVGVAALFINYCTESGTNITNAEASYLLAMSLLLFTIGRFAGTALMRKIPAGKLLGVYATVNVCLCIAVMAHEGWISVYALMAIFFFQSIMFPTIFALGLKDLGHHTKKASSYLVMSIVGGALVPYVMGALADKFSTPLAYGVPAVCFIVVARYGWMSSAANSAIK